MILPLLFSCGSFFFLFGQENWENFNESNSSLPNNTIRCLLVDRNNSLWIGTDNGLAQYDGTNWTIYNTSNSPLTDNYIRALAVDSMNQLYIGTTLSGIYTFDGVNWENYTSSNSNLPDNFIRALTIDPQQRLWVGTVEGLARLDQGVWTIWTMANSGFLSNNITSIATTETEQYIGTINGGLIYMNSSGISNYTILTAGVPDNSVISVQLDQLNRPWYGSTAQGIFTDNGNQTWLSFNVMNSPLPSNSITAFELDEMDNFLIGTHQDGFVLRENTSDWYHFNTANSPLPDNHILACTRDSNQVIWLGTFDHGLVKMWVSQSELAEIRTKQFHLYPNPATQNSTVFWSENEEFQQLLIRDLTGKLVYHQSLTAGQYAIELPRLNPSMYILEFQNDRRMVRTQLQIAP